MKAFPFSRLRAIAAKSPITPVCHVFSFSAGAVLSILIAFVGAPAGVPTASAQTVTYSGGAVNFGTANVCPSGKTVPAPCSQTMTLTYNVTASGTLGTPKALTTGTPDLDYKLASGTTCTGSVFKGNTCKVNVTFAPIAPGARNGAVEIVDSSGNVLVTTYIYGTGAGPAVAFNPGVPVSVYNIIDAAAMAVDAAGNIFVITRSYGGSTSLYEILAAGGYTTVDPFGFAFNSLSGVAVDGAGNVFVTGSENGAEVPSVKEILAAGGYTTLKTLFSSYRVVGGVAVDGSGNVFFSSLPSYGGGVTEIFADGGYTKVKSLGSGISAGCLALDGSGNVYITEISDYGPVKEMTAASGYSTVKTLGSTIFNSPCVAAVDASGNVYVSSGIPPDTVISEILAVGDYATVYTVITTNYPAGFAMDTLGNLYLTNPRYNAITVKRRSQPPSFAFGSANVGTTSASSPLSTTIQNIGNTNLAGTALAVSPNWHQVAGSGTPEDCTANFSMSPGAQCNLSISFEPAEGGPLTGAATLVDNSLNARDATQSVPLSGTGIAAFPPPQITGLSATYGAAYSWVRLTGVKFGTSQGSSTVTFNGIPAPIYRWSDTLIWSTAPASPPDAVTGNVVVTVNGEKSNGVAFTALPMPMVTGISPTSGPVGTVVTISGVNLVDYENQGKVGFNGKYLPILSQSSTAIKVAIPTGAVTDHFHVLVNDTGMNTPTFSVTP